MIGRTISHYRIAQKLGAGGRGEVYQATDTNLGRDVTIKILPEALARDPERLARFQREAQLLASLNHPNVAAVYGLDDQIRHMFHFSDGRWLYFQPNHLNIYRMPADGGRAQQVTHFPE